ncbi:PilN domain-containing protein [Synechococcus sp. CS-602]|uniref:PilN domain-containing protein n=1 Tax=unclassified Synechococcus TaxID=2626047 RepID=UPI0008FF234C|nr:MULTISPECIES: PilN domain-containing protein [unclassified Synechococcus]APD47916.1 hypothetical protein BM449_06200 [Synechococcus sp. SynAce01]MCT0204960.1 PilN domain-containing protein [Synechococcus sp. CS-602]MCT0244788.1 PilN domain-containing protein [Synechococcus sp. CS-601]TWB91485.1 type IV pilus assembly protein PilN [Synechococcus sp. Ace-Pa]
MTRTLPAVDLLRERRIELGLPPDPSRGPDPRRLLWIGAAVAAGLVSACLALALLLRWQQQRVSNDLAQLQPVRAEVEQLEQQLIAEKAAIDATGKANAELAGALVTLRSGTALMTDLAERSSTGVQLTGVKVNNDDLEIKGRSSDPGAFERINALVLRLKASPLLDPASVRLKRAGRADAEGGEEGKPQRRQHVDFELTATFRPPRSGPAQLRLLQELGADGMAQRLQVLQQQGLLP